jgi:hypothetical protein
LDDLEMSKKTASLRARLRLIGAGILFVGLASAATVYVTAAGEPRAAAAYEIVGGEVFPIMHDDSKRYRRDVQMYGGKAAVMANDFSLWFFGLWQGTQLAYTLASLAAGCALACFCAAHFLPDQ